MHREGKVQKEGPMEDLPARSDLVKRPYGKKDLRRVVKDMRRDPAWSTWR